MLSSLRRPLEHRRPHRVVISCLGVGQPSSSALQGVELAVICNGQPPSWSPPTVGPLLYGDHHQPAAEIPTNGLGQAVDSGNLTRVRWLPRTGEKHVAAASHDEVLGAGWAQWLVLPTRCLHQPTIVTKNWGGFLLVRVVLART